MNLLICVNTITTGGAELFAIRLANAMSARNISVILFNLRRDKVEQPLLNKLEKGVKFKNAAIPAINFIEKVDGFLFKLGINFSFLNYFIFLELKKLVREKEINVIHSHLYTVDKIVAKLKRIYPLINLITTIHGDYEANWLKFEQGQKIYREKNFKNISKRILKEFNHIVCITSNQVALFEQKKKEYGLYSKIIKIYNGYPEINKKAVYDLKYLGIKNSDFVYGMVSRGIPEKGWELLIRAFLKLELDNVHLLLVGDSFYIQELKSKYQNKRIHFLGGTVNVLPIIQSMDVGILPTQINTEGLPTVIIEYLVCGCPVITSEIGEIPHMIKSPTGMAGKLIKITTDPEEYVQNLTLAMDNIKVESQKIDYSEKAKSAFLKFRLEECVSLYENLYSDGN